MKNLRKFFMIVLSMAMSIVMTISAFPAIGYTISVVNSTHTYEVYQIFTGYAYDGVVVDLQWGVNGTGTVGEYVSQDILDELEATAGMTDREKLEVIQKYANLDATNKFGTVSADNPLQYIPGGYYLIKDIDGIFEGEDDTYTTYIARVVTDIEISPKSDKTTADKTVTDVNDYTGETTVGETADYDINDEVPFQLSATIDSEYERYAAYKLTFHDTLSSGLRFNASSVSVKVDAGALVNGQDYTLVTEGLSDGCTFEVQLTNLKTIEEVKAGSVITVDYTATLTSEAVIGSAGNTNTMFVEYSNNPNDETGTEMGKTPEETAVVFTYQMVVNKITENPDYDPNVEGSLEYIPLAGAEFELEKLVKKSDSSGYKWEVVDVIVSEDGTTFTFSGLDDGQYRLTEIWAPDKYNSIEPIYFVVDATVDGNQVTALSGTQTDENGVILEGNKITATFTANAANGTLATDVVNVMGVQLPETGGIGTTIFYVTGGSLIFASAVMFVLRRHKERTEEK